MRINIVEGKIISRSFLEDFSIFRFYCGFIFQETFLLNNFKQSTESGTMSITKMRTTEVFQRTYTISYRILMRERKQDEPVLLQDVLFVSTLLNELP